jgi:hypothetical protein
MPNLRTTFTNHDLGFLKIIAEHWGIELHAPDQKTALDHLVSLMLDVELLQEVVETLPVEAQAAFNTLLEQGGRMEWARFSRLFGTIREMGAGRRDRSRPDLQPSSAAESLWYHGLVGRGFFDSAGGPQEMVYIPDDLLLLLPERRAGQSAPVGRRAAASEHAFEIKVNDWILDDVCTLLAWIRSGLADEQPLSLQQPLPWAIKVTNHPALSAITGAAELLSANKEINTDLVKEFLEAGRGEALIQLAQSWLYSNDCDDLRHLPNLIFEGEWSNNPLRTRRAIMDLIAAIPEGSWWSLTGFIAGVKAAQPDFQRTAGEYDSWYIRDRRTGEYLQGFENWGAVDGALLHYLITGPLFWLGLLDLAASTENAPVSAFRKSSWWQPLLEGSPPPGLPTEDETLLISSDARLRAPRLVPRPARYQVARFARWEDAGPDAYRYRITPESLERARKQGLVVGQLVALLRKFALTVPPSLVKALERWESRGIEARIQPMLVLQVGSPDMLQVLRQSRAARFFGELLGPTSVAIHANAAEKVLAILAELGYLGEAKLESQPEAKGKQPE